MLSLSVCTCDRSSYSFPCASMYDKPDIISLSSVKFMPFPPCPVYPVKSPRSFSLSLSVCVYVCVCVCYKVDGFAGRKIYFHCHFLCLLFQFLFPQCISYLLYFIYHSPFSSKFVLPDSISSILGSFSYFCKIPQGTFCIFSCCFLGVNI